MPDAALQLAGTEQLHQPDSLLGAAFPDTQWILVRRAQGDGADAVRAMNDLCRRYWYPIYAYLRCRSYERSDAQDITQGFFLKVVTTGLIQSADQSRGRLRNYLLGALNRHLVDHLRHEKAEKRGGRAIVLPLRCETAEERFSNEPADLRDPETLYLAAWARDLIGRVHEQLRNKYISRKRGDIFEALQSALATDDTAVPYRDLAEKLNASEAALRLQVFRLRRSFGRMLRDEVARTVETPEELEEEIAWLANVLRKSSASNAT